MSLKSFSLLALSFTITFIFVTQPQTCTNSSYQRCLCTTNPPYCPCAAITSTSNLNFSSNYNSHLVLISNMGCLPCSASCNKCKNATACTQCLANYQLRNNTCIPCPINCQICSNGVCSMCVSSYYLDYQTNCQVCPQIGTNLCTINSLLTCLPNYWLDNNAANCIQCDINCQQCSSTTKCSICNNGYYLLYSNYSCQPCQTQCYQCTNATACTICMNQTLYFNVSLNLCVEGSSSNCATYFNSSACTQCQYGYYSVNYTCKLVSSVSLVDYCKIYQQSTGKVSCATCLPGYYLLSSICNYGCSNLCATCFGPHYGNCFSCDTGAVLYNFNCLPTFNLNQGSTYQLFFNALNDPTFFINSKTILPNNCIPETIQNGNQIILKLSNLQGYQIKLTWKVYVILNRDQNLSNFINQSIYSIRFTNKNIDLLNNFTANYCSNCSLNIICIDKNSINFSNNIENENYIFMQAISENISISEILITVYRCGGVSGQQCLTCSSIDICTKCVNPNYFISGFTCVIACPNSNYVRVATRTCYSACPSSTYPNDSTQQCLECLSPCLSCVSNNICISCVDGFYFNEQNNSCLEVCPMRFYKNIQLKRCLSCLYPCFQCLDNIRCLSCIYGFYNNFTNSCVLKCEVGYYGNISTLTCESCSFPCLTCTSYNDSQCLSCANGYNYFNLKCQLDCPISYYSFNYTCLLCHQTCRTCNQSFDKCTSCPSASYLFNFSCINACPSSFFGDRLSLICVSCATQCLTCTSLSLCINCKSNFNYFAKNYSCVQNCPDLYYSYNFKCLSCRLPCEKCLNQTYCLSCKNLFFINGQCTSMCLNGTFGNSTTMLCQSCDLNLCKTCYSFPTECTSCYDGLLLVNNQCIQSCLSGYYYFEGSNSCLPCVGKCKTCLNTSYCLSCTLNFILYNGICLSTCMQGFYLNMTNQNERVCSPCPSVCTSCQIIQQDVYCFACINNYYFYNGQCSKNCPKTYYSYNNNCIKCKVPCNECLTSTKCISCLKEYGVLSNNSCVPICPFQYYENQTNNKCDKCSQECLSCQYSFDNCTSCNNSLFLQYYQNQTNQFSRCLSQCEKGYYHTIYSNLCNSCQKQCLSCSLVPSNCTQCKNNSKILLSGQCLDFCPNGFYPNSNKCSSCPKTCQLCFNQTFCQNCNIGYFLNPNYMCYSECPLTYYPLNGLCLNCEFPCYTCTSYSKCLTCISGYLFNNICSSTCPRKTYPNQTFKICEACPSNCSLCTFLDNCIECMIGVLVNGTCQQNCPTGYYNYYSICVPCMYGCIECLNSTVCSYCYKGYLFQGMCLDYCPIGWVANPNSTFPICQKCIENCIKCTTLSTQCTLCASGYFLYIYNCVIDCPIGSYKNYQLSSCITCNSPCLTCSNAYSCLTCIYSYILYSEQMGNQCIEGPSCPNSFFLDMEQNSCVYKCAQNLVVQYSKMTCSKQCFPTYVLYQQNNTCLEYCPNNMWINSEYVCSALETAPFNLPFMTCMPIILRNLLFIKCKFTTKIENIDQLTIQDFHIDEFVIYSIKIMQNDQIILITNQNTKIFRSQKVSIYLTKRYKLFAQINLANSSFSNNSSKRLLAVQPIPVQNIVTSVYIDNFIVYSQDQRTTGIQLYQISQSISLGAFIIWIFALIKNMKATSLTFVVLLQWLYTISLLQASFAPNLGQFLEGFKLSALIYKNFLAEESFIWKIDTIFRSNLWGISNLFDFKIIFLPSLYVIITFGLFNSVICYFQKYFQKYQTNPQLKLSLKFKILMERFLYNYWFHCILVTLSPLTIGISCQIIAANAIGLTFSIICFIFYFCLIVGVIKYHYQGHTSFVSTKYFILVMVETIIQNGLVVLVTVQFYLGISIFLSAINIYIWNHLFGHKKSIELKHFYQINDLLKIIILIQILVGYTKLKSWEDDQYYNYSWVIISTIFLLIIFVAIHSAKQFFDIQEQPNQKIEKQSNKVSSQESKQRTKKHGLAHLLKQSQQDEPEIQQVSFFSNKDPVIDSDSDADIIDFDEIHNQSQKAPKQLKKIDKKGLQNIRFT